MNHAPISGIRFFLSERIVVSNLWKLFLVGAIGMSFSYTRPFFIRITPFFLLFCFLLISIYELFPLNKKFKIRLFVYMVVVYMLSFLIEMYAVNIGSVFGNYTYGSGLGIKIYHTPLLIGVNWLMASLGSGSLAAIASRSMGFGRHRWFNFLFRILSGCVLMLLLDLVMEQVAPMLDFWSWTDGEIPDSNYRGWLVVSFIFQLYYTLNSIQLRSFLFPLFFLFQFIYFSVLWLCSLI